jgi:hypothetical protein
MHDPVNMVAPHCMACKVPGAASGTGLHTVSLASGRGASLTNSQIRHPSNLRHTCRSSTDCLGMLHAHFIITCSQALRNRPSTPSPPRTKQPADACLCVLRRGRSHRLPRKSGRCCTAKRGAAGLLAGGCCAGGVACVACCCWCGAACSCCCCRRCNFELCVACLAAATHRVCMDGTCGANDVLYISRAMCMWDELWLRSTGL